MEKPGMGLKWGRRALYATGVEAIKEGRGEEGDKGRNRLVAAAAAPWG